MSRGSIPPGRSIYIDIMEFKLDTNGYKYIYAPTNPYANKVGKVYEHILVMCNHIKRKLNPDECIHHKDRNKINNSLENLVLLTFSEHARLHLKEDRNIIFETRYCETCKKPFIVSKNSGQKYCSNSCFRISRRHFEISKEDLFILVWSMPTTKVAKQLGISDVAVGKRCKLLGIPKPPRGYWRKVYTGVITHTIPDQIN